MGEIRGEKRGADLCTMIHKSILSDGPSRGRETMGTILRRVKRQKRSLAEHVIRFIVFLDRGSRYTRIYSSRRVAYVNTKIDKTTSGREDRARRPLENR